MNPYSSRWQQIHGDCTRDERRLAKMEAEHADGQVVLVCPKCGQAAYYRPGVGAHQCVSCRAIRRYDGKWV